MAGPRAMYLVRDAGGRMYTVIARSVRGALMYWMQKNKPRHGDLVSVKLRGGTEDWTDYTISV